MWGNDPRKRKYPVGHSCFMEKALLTLGGVRDRLCARVFFCECTCSIYILGIHFIRCQQDTNI